MAERRRHGSLVERSRSNGIKTRIFRNWRRTSVYTNLNRWASGKGMLARIERISFPSALKFTSLEMEGGGVVVIETGLR